MRKNTVICPTSSQKLAHALYGAVGTLGQNRRARADLQFHGDVNITGEASLN
jgi:hypothetical protein